MLVRALLFAGTLMLISAGCVVGDDESTTTAVPTAAISTPQATLTADGEAQAPTTTSTAAQQPDESTATASSAGEATAPTASPPPADATATVTPLPPAPSATAIPEPPPLDDLNVGLELVADGLDQPDGFAVANDGQNRLFILEQPGRIRIVAEGALIDQPFLDITERVGNESTEQGLLGLAFHPAYTDNGRFFVNYTDNNGNTVISEFTVGGDPNVADPASERLVLFVEQPAGNHNGGHLLFGPDGYLWIGLGDGGAAGDRFGNAQNPATLLGSMLRIDVDGAEPYAIPPDNPFVDNPDARPEIWAIGLRNPWRYSFDRMTGDLYIADVGQGAWEEIHRTAAGTSGGLNYGWPIIEGSHCYASDSCSVEGLQRPVVEYDHAGGNCAVTGGYVYRGSASPALWGTYFYADYCSGRFWGLRMTEDGADARLIFQRDGALFSSFGEDENGEVYILSLQSGAVYRLVSF